MLKGVPVAIASNDEVKDPWQLSSFIRKHQVTRVSFVPSYLSVLICISSATQNLESLKLCVSSGEPLTSSLAMKFFSVLRSSCRLLNLYGSSEVCADVTYFEVTSENLKINGNHILVPIGKPILNVSIKL